MMSSENQDSALPPAPARPARRGVWKLYLLLVVCVAPVVASYLMYYVFPPSGRTNYGMLIQPQRPVPAALAGKVLHVPQGRTAPAVPPEKVQSQGLAAFDGTWILLAIDRGACEAACAQKLYFMRQTHVSLGKERDRMVRVLVLTDDTPLPDAILTAHPGLAVLRMDSKELEALFPVLPDTTRADHLYLIDPLHNLMMQFPKDPDPTRTRKDLQRLMKASRIG